MSCSNCFNGCSEIVSDQCVRYTGIDIPVLGIQNGDSLSYVEQSLITFLTSTLDGTGIKIDINPSIICTLVQKYLPTCGDLTVVDLITALIKATCDLQVQVDATVVSIAAINSQLTTLNGPYTIGSCLTGVTSTSGTHAILQATINALCQFIATAPVTYVLSANLDTLIQNYLDTIYPPSQQYTKMIPYTVLPYFGSISYFDGSGAGFPNLGWDKVYLCNGNNSTPDLRGRVLVGSIQGMGGGPLSPAVDPAVNPTYNPNYALNTIAGTNHITLTKLQIPSHTHDVSDPGHTHDYFKAGTIGATDTLTTGISSSVTGTTSSNVTNITILPNGGGLPHQNNQPSWACYYIIYIP